MCQNCIHHAPTNWKCTCDKKNERLYERASGMTLRSIREHRPREREDRKSLMVFQRSAVAADEDIERVVLSRYIGTVLAGPHE